jgi:hypothetical protein
MENLKFYLGLPYTARQRSLSRSRAPMDKPAFVAEISAAGGDEDAAAFVWDNLSQYVFHGGYTVYPEDSFYHLFGIANEEVDEDIVLAYLEKSGLSVPLAQQAATGSVDSALEICRFISKVRSFKKQGSE